MSSTPNRSKIRRFGPNAPTYKGHLGGPTNRLMEFKDPTVDLAIERRSPAIPASIQTSLLQVGMRVRKSVFDGYRTNAKYLGSSIDYSLHVGPTTKSRHTRQVDIYEDAYEEDVSMKGYDSFPSSQESTTSTTSSMAPPVPAPRTKRTIDDFGDEEQADDFPEDNAPVLGNIEQVRNRKIARPKTRKYIVSPSIPMDEDFGEADFLVYDEQAERE